MANDGSHEMVYSMGQKVLYKPGIFFQKIFDLRGLSKEAIVIFYETSLNLPIRANVK